MASGQPAIARYDVLGRLATGGMGQVWLARAQGPAGFEKLVVLKTIRPDSTNPSATAMFLHEARVAARLSHPNCVQVFELVEEQEGYFLVMEFIDGMSLARIVKRGAELQRPIPIGVAARIAIDAAAGLEYAHTLCDVEGKPLSIVHRDVSLENILVTFSGQTKLVDFGIAKAVGMMSEASTASGTVKGKAGYMAPEYLRGDSAGPQIDLFSLGVVLYRALTGKKPYDGETDAQVITSVLESTPKSVGALRGDIPQALEAAVDRALAKDPRQRFASARAMRAAIASAVPHVAEVEGVATYLATLWPPDDRDRVAIRRLASSHDGSASSLPSEAAHTAATVVELPKSRAWKVIAANAVAAGAIATGVLVYGRSSHHAAPRPNGRIQVVVADVRNDTGEPLFDGALEATFAMALEEAPSITAFPRSQAHRVAGDAHLDEDAARKVAAREGLYAVTTESIAKSASGFAISIRAIDAASGDQLAVARGEAADKEHVLATVAQLAIPIRQALGDATPEATQREGIARLTPHSLEAAHAFAEARDLVDNIDPAGAAKALRRVLELDPDFDAAYPLLAASYLNLDQADQARAAFQQAFARIDRMSDRQRFMTRGMYYATQGEPKKALDVYLNMVERFPDDRVALRHLAQTYSVLNQNGKALETAKRILDRDPKDLRARSNAAVYAVSAGDFEGGEKLARELVELQPDSAAATWVLAAAAYYQGHEAEALAVLDKVRTRPSDESQTAMFRAEIALAQGRTSDVAAILDPALATDIERHDTTGAAIKQNTLARAKLARGDTAGAIASADQAIATSPDPTVAFDAARNYIQAGELAKAKQIEAQLGQRIEDVNRSYAKVLEGELALHAGRASEAIEALRAAIALYDSWIATFDLGRAYLEADAFPQAHEALSACLQRRGEVGLFVSMFPATWYYLGRAQEGLQSPAAAESFRRYIAARAAAENDPLAADAKRRLR
jgi:serine/threonine protein kinase/tetratricopeptide (TPR) repeat protein